MTVGAFYYFPCVAPIFPAAAFSHKDSWKSKRRRLFSTVFLLVGGKGDAAALSA